MTIQPGNTSRLNIVKGCSQLLEVDSSDKSLSNKVLPANILLKDNNTTYSKLSEFTNDSGFLTSIEANADVFRITEQELDDIFNQHD